MKDIKYEIHEEKIKNGQTDKVNNIFQMFSGHQKGFRKTKLVVIDKDQETIGYKCILTRLCILDTHWYTESSQEEIKCLA